MNFDDYKSFVENRNAEKYKKAAIHTVPSTVSCDWKEKARARTLFVLFTNNNKNYPNLSPVHCVTFGTAFRILPFYMGKAFTLARQNKDFMHFTCACW